MRVLITGATGFLGKYLIQEFASRGCTVFAFGRNAQVGRTLRDCVYIQGDFTSFAEIERAVKGMDVVIHAGALSTVWGKREDFEKANVTGT